ncbi:hypothetical protein RRG08_039549 [Elysia crispata]|uniref:Uncharacterized protein n=1 Tax=Elysia crispata TaxID=231223 RepID=A0AAE0YKQ9_9GAST|nr:hypothetical protein RRG08_039549 [Elysia crispata]
MVVGTNGPWLTTYLTEGPLVGIELAHVGPGPLVYHRVWNFLVTPWRYLSAIPTADHLACSARQVIKNGLLRVLAGTLQHSSKTSTSAKPSRR